MPGLALAMTAEQENVLARARAERRQYQRVRIESAGRLFVPVNGQEARCQIVDLSPGGAQVVCEVTPPADAQVILYIDGFGRFEGNVVRPSENGFGVRFQCSLLKREKIAEQLTVYMNRDIAEPTVVRRHDRAPTKGTARFTRANGEIVACEVVDLSLSGVSLKTDARPPMGEVVLIGQSAGRVVRYHQSGIAIEFVTAQADKTVVEKVAEKPFNPFAVVG
jgi:PilZ domain-containing protein